MKQTHSVTLYGIEVTGENYYEHVDDSFDHAFGTEECGHWEAVDTTLLEAFDRDGNDIPLNTLSEEFKKQAIEALQQVKI